MKMEKITKLMELLAKKSETPSNSAHQYQINRDFGFLAGMQAVLDLVEPYQVNENEINRLLDEIEADYKNPELINQNPSI